MGVSRTSSSTSMRRALVLAAELAFASYAAASVAGPVTSTDFPDPSIVIADGTYDIVRRK